jgi:hypothetical protein
MEILKKTFNFETEEESIIFNIICCLRFEKYNSKFF